MSLRFMGRLLTARGRHCLRYAKLFNLTGTLAFGKVERCVY